MIRLGTDAVLSKALQKFCCNIVLTPVATMPLMANEAAVAFSNARQSSLYFFRRSPRQQLVRSDVAGRVTLTAWT
jgi:hypothetical protein